MRTLPLGRLDQYRAVFIADRAPESFTMRTQCRFIGFFLVVHASTTILTQNIGHYTQIMDSLPEKGL
jgi:hypothetical protein